MEEKVKNKKEKPVEEKSTESSVKQEPVREEKVRYKTRRVEVLDKIERDNSIIVDVNGYGVMIANATDYDDSGFYTIKYTGRIGEADWQLV